MRAIFYVWSLVAVAALLQAQVPSERWMTLRTEHFRVHYPADYEAWTLRLAPRMEAVRQAVAEAAGYAPAEVVDVLVMDPFSLSNGMVLPFLRYPRMILWTTPPEPWSPIGHYRDWPELLFLHEEVHAVHLLRPSRGAWGRLIERLLPLGAIERKAPRWVSEGYATLLEGKLTGAGRPNGDFRAALIRKWALEGKLPSYGQMADDAESWLGMSMAYLMGSAYMEWLEARSDAEVWRRLWARLTAKKNRSFDEAFEGVFGENPARLYDRFTAELTWRAMELERRMAPALAEGDLWADLTWTTGEPIVSPDGKKMAIVIRQKDGPSRLVVWDTAPDSEAEKKWSEESERNLRRDPEDAPAVRSKPFPPKVLFEMPPAAAREPLAQRWMPDGQSILFVSHEPDADGFYAPDLFLWTLKTGRVRRATRGASLREADPFPDGRRALAVHSRFGFVRLVEVDLETGALKFLTEPSLEIVWSQPRVSPDGRRAVALRHAEGRWDLVRFDFDGPALEPVAIALPEGAVPLFPAWSADGQSVFASLGRGGFVDVHVSDPALEAMTEPLTRTRGAAFAPAPAPDGRGLYFLSLEPDGLDVRYLAFEKGAGAGVDWEKGGHLAPAVRPVPPRGLTFEEQEIGGSEPYGAGRQELSLLFGGYWTAYARAWEAGVRGGDVLGRWNYFVAGGGGEGGVPEGGTFALGWRGWPLEVMAQAYRVEQGPSEAKGWPESFDPDPRSYRERDRRGGSLTLARQWTTRRGKLNLEVGGWREAVRSPRLGEMNNDWERSMVYGEGSGMLVHPLGSWEVLAALAARGEWGETDRDGWNRARIQTKAGLQKGESSLFFSYERRVLRGLAAAAGTPAESLSLGGIDSTLLPRAARFDAVLDPALLQDHLFGDRYEGWRVDLMVGGVPFFYQRHRLRRDHPQDGDPADGIALAGLEWDMTSGPLAVARFPGFHLTLGGAYAFDVPLEGKTRLWLGLAWRP